MLSFNSRCALQPHEVLEIAGRRRLSCCPLPSVYIRSITSELVADSS